MFARTWHGHVPAEKADAYHRYLPTTGVLDYKTVPSNQDVHMLRRLENSKTHFLIITFWASWEAIRAVAGEDVEKARYYPEDEALLLELEPTVTHYEVLV